MNSTRNSPIPEKRPWWAVLWPKSKAGQAIALLCYGMGALGFVYLSARATSLAQPNSVTLGPEVVERLGDRDIELRLKARTSEDRATIKAVASLLAQKQSQFRLELLLDGEIVATAAGRRGNHSRDGSALYIQKNLEITETVVIPMDHDTLVQARVVSEPGSADITDTQTKLTVTRP